MSFRISPIHDYDRFLAIDLGTYRIRTSCFGIDNGDVLLEGYASVRQNRRNIESGSISDMAGVARLIEKSIYEACRESSDIPEDMILSYTPSTSFSSNLASQYVRSDPESPLSMDELDIMIEKIERIALLRAKDRAKKEYAIIHDDIRLVSSTLTSIMIDGIPIDDPLGSKGSHVRITVLNIYTTASEHNMLRSIVSSLRKNTISLIPSTLLFPKLMERTEFARENSLVIDIGYTHLTLVSSINGEVQYTETFRTGSRMLFDMIQERDESLSDTIIENLLHRDDGSDKLITLRDECMMEYCSYLVDTISGVLQREGDALKSKYIVLSGGLLSSTWAREIWKEQMNHHITSPREYLDFRNIVTDTPLSSEYLLTEALSSIGYELLHTKKDPLIRILRYTLYHYE